MTHPVDSSDPRVDTVSVAAQRWRHELAELGGRNTLLWHKDLPRGTFDLTVAHPSGVAKLLAGHRTLLSELVREQIAREQARAKVAAIHAKTVELSIEHGVASCFIAVGMATWRLRRAKTAPRAPVLIRGAQIRPVDAAYRDFVLQLDHDVVFNPVLENYLRGEAGIDIDATALATLSASDGFDPRETYQALEDLCASVAGFGINPQMVIGTYPWAKLDLVAHLSRDPAKLAGHDLIAALAAPNEAEPLSTPVAPDPDDPRQELSVLDADAPQRSVIADVHHRASLVLDTPAGTGATQTVANVLAGALAQGRTALVVSQERPALDALRRRLAYVGLDDLVLDVPEDRRRARAAIAALAARLDDVHEEPELPADPLPRWFQAREVLARHEECMHQVHQPWGQSLAQTHAALAGLAGLARPPLSHVRLAGPVLRELPGARIAEMKEVLTQAASEGLWQRGRVEDPWYAANLRSESDADRAAALVGTLATGELTTAREEIAQVCRTAGLPEPLNLSQWQQRLDLLARVHETSDHFAPQIYEAPLTDLIAAVCGRGLSSRLAGADRQASERMGAVTRGRLKRQVRFLLRPGKPPADLLDRLIAAREERAQWEDLAGKAARPHTPPGWDAARVTFASIGPDTRWLAEVLTAARSGTDLMTTHLDLLLERLLRLDARRDRARFAARAHVLLHMPREMGLGPMIDDLARRGVSADDVPAEVELAYQTSLLDHIAELQAEDMAPTPRVAAAAKQFRIADRDHLALNVVRVRRTVARRLARAMAAYPGQVRALRAAAADGAGDIRAVITRSPDIVLALRPVLVASPLVVPATLPDSLRVDLVVVTHAHRARTAACIAALSHAPQALIVGDHLRGGPQSFSYAVQEAESTEPADPCGHGPSVLDEASAILPVRTLGTHYRAINQSMVGPVAAATTPSVESFPGVWSGSSVAQRLVPNPDNLVATATSAAVDVLLRGRTASLAILTDEPQRAQGIHEALRVAAGNNSVVREALHARRSTGVICVPMARWAGEVRDQVMWVREPGREATSAEVITALAAARRSLTLIGGDRIGTDRHGPGSQLLEGLLAPREQGRRSSEQDHPLMQDLMSRLIAEGFTVRRHVGTGRYAVPLAIEHPDRPGRLLVAIDVDLEPGPHEIGRDDMRLRPDQLTRVGWTPIRVLGTNLFRDPAREVAAVVSTVRHAAREKAGAAS